ncbi:hypothetical protein OB955_17440 [Halobacteria archaeon AArc-m2/3/4]|uniref:DUF8055 domain-containing protein n=1 Tax=Natronoglomus mannanivorans TaxID=2979990 RepID=A0AAP2YZL5_9EURY|nr:hypothetical protein [Halobacteria archaeon AArc-xg1-1]MCU4974507.1 hypothetical protein [Halobacteria archaeon AArc-m2/3/4]
MERYGSHIAALARRAERDHRDFDPAEASPADVTNYLQEGAGQAIWLYVEARTGGRLVPFSEAELSALQDAMNTWLELYARCYGVDLEAEFTVREAAELLVDTRNIRDTAQLLTRVPGRRAEVRDSKRERTVDSK